MPATEENKSATSAPAAAPEPEKKPKPQAAEKTEEGGASKVPMRTEKLPVGIAGVSIKEEPRDVPVDDPPPLAPNEKLNVIGKPTARLDGRLKVTGAARYTADINLPGM